MKHRHAGNLIFAQSAQRHLIENSGELREPFQQAIANWLIVVITCRFVVGLPAGQLTGMGGSVVPKQLAVQHPISLAKTSLSSERPERLLCFRWRDGCHQQLTGSNSSEAPAASCRRAWPKLKQVVGNSPQARVV